MTRHTRSALLLLLVLLGGAPHAADVSAPALYNQGNAHARAHEWGLAALYYQRARLLAPEDPDVEANLRLVQAAAKTDVSVPAGPARLTRLTSPDVAGGLGLLGMLILGCALLRAGAVRLIAIIAGIPLVAFAAGYALGLRPLLHSGVVTGSTTAQASPVPMADALFPVPEATTVLIRDERPDYVLVTLPSGQSGWVLRSHLTALVPRDR